MSTDLLQTRAILDVQHDVCIIVSCNTYLRHAGVVFPHNFSLFLIFTRVDVTVYQHGNVLYFSNNIYLD